MPPGVNHRHYHVEADGRLDRRRYQYRRTDWEAIDRQSKAAPESRWCVVAGNMLERFAHRL